MCKMNYNKTKMKLYEKYRNTNRNKIKVRHGDRKRSF